MPDGGKSEPEHASTSVSGDSVAVKIGNGNGSEVPNKDGWSSGAVEYTVPAMRLDIRNLQYAPLIKAADGSRTRRTVLHSLTTTFKAGTLTALMGPSGSGKTSLLSVVAGFVRRSDVYGSILVNGEQRPLPRKLVGVVFQDDMMLPALTVFETIKFTADLRMPNCMGISDNDRRLECLKLLERLGLSHVVTSLVGGAATRGISGGERKRLAVGVELISRPALLLMDEPTSGLDAAAALSLMRLLHSLADAGQTVIAAIHQPRTTVFDAFHHLLLLTKGRAVFDGSPTDCIPSLEVMVGKGMPPRTNPADWIMDVIAEDEAHSEGSRVLVKAVTQGGAEEAKVNGEAGAADLDKKENGEELGNNNDRGGSGADGDSSWRDGGAGAGTGDGGGGDTLTTAVVSASFWRQLWVLSKRENKSRRGMNLTRLNFLQMASMATLTGLFWWQMDGTDKYIMERYSLLFFTIIAQSNAVVLQCVNTFARERQLISRERSKGMYAPLPFFIARTLSDTVNTLVLPSCYAAIAYWCAGLRPDATHFIVFLCAFAMCVLVAQSLGLFLSCAISNVQLSLIVAPMLILMLMILGGFYVNFSSMPVFVKWLSWVSQARYGFTAMVINEFKGRTFECTPGTHTRFGSSCPVKGEEVISALEMDYLSVGSCMGYLLIMQALLRCAAYFALRANTGGPGGSR